MNPRNPLSISYTHIQQLIPLFVFPTLRQKTTASVSTALEGSLNHHGQISAGNECGENNEYNTEDEEVSQLPPDCDNEEMYLESVDFKHPSLNEDHG